MNTKLFLVAIGIIGGVLATGFADEPRIVRENIEWLDVWVPNTNATDLPRVLLIGDSITRGYFKDVEEKLKGKAHVARLATSKSVGDVGSWQKWRSCSVRRASTWFTSTTGYTAGATAKTTTGSTFRSSLRRSRKAPRTRS
jgi:hypothetical protein